MLHPQDTDQTERAMVCERFDHLNPTNHRRYSSTPVNPRGTFSTNTTWKLASVILLLVFLLASPGTSILAQETPTPDPQRFRGADQASGYTGDIANLTTAVDTFWSDTFAAAGISYRSPRVTLVEQFTGTGGCGLADPDDWPFYCPPDETVYLQPKRLNLEAHTIGDYAPIMILAHEWGHHVQRLTNT